MGIDATDTTVLDNPSPIIPAATVVLVRDGDGGLEVLLVRRVGRGSFAGFSVFPGGKLDPEDHDPERPGDEVAAATRAAVREAREEVGLEVHIDSLVALSYWVPPPFEMKRFGTWFFVAPTVDGEIVVSEGELTHHDWVAPAQALADAAKGDRTLAPPTWVTLHRLSGHATVEECIADLRTGQPQRFETWPLRRDPMVLCWEPDHAHRAPVGTVDLEADGPRHRLFMHDTGWVYERT